MDQSRREHQSLQTPDQRDHDAHEHADHQGHKDHAPAGHDAMGSPTPDSAHAGHDHHDHAGHAGHDDHDHDRDRDGHAGHEQAGHDHHEHAGHAGHDDSEHAGHDQSGHAEHDHSGHAEHDHSGHAGHGGHDHHGHGGHAGHVAMFRRLFWVMLAFAVPTVAFSGMFAMLLGYPLPDSGPVTWISPVLGTVMFAIGGRPFLTGAVDEIRAKQPGMMLLIGLAITVAFVASWLATLGVVAHDLDFWWELALLIVIMLLGHWIEMRSLAQAGSALDSLAALLPDEAERVSGSDPAATETVSPADLRVGDVVIVRPGGRVPADGEVVDGAADVDESMITGESAPVARTVGDRVVAGTVSTDSALRIRVTATGDDTALAGIQRLVSDAQASSSRAQRLADRAAGWLFWYALGAGILTAIVWSAIGRPDDALINTITVLVIACPHALGLAIPLVVSISTERAARAGVLVTDRLALETMRTVDTVLFDKTGTLTKGEPALVGITAVAGRDEDAVLALAASAEADSEHPLAVAIVAAASAKGLDVPRASGFRSTVGTGVGATVDGRAISVGGPGLLTERGAHPLPAADEWASHGRTVLHVLDGDEVIGALALADEVRPESRTAVAALAKRGVEVVMVTGDAQTVADAVAADLGITRVFAGVRPEDKASTVRALQAEGKKVAMVGDGVNDAPALAQADVGLAIGAGTDVAIASAGVVLASSDPRSVVSVIDLSSASYRKMQQNLWWAAGYNLISVPLAAGVLAPIGFVMPMAVGALLMSASTVIVALNAQLLRRIDLSPERISA